MQNFWENSDPQKRAWQPLIVVQSYYRIRLIIHAVLLIVAGIGLFRLITQAQSIPTVYVVDKDQRVTLTSPRPFEMSGQKIAALADDVIAALFTRTEHGRIISDLSPFVDESILAAVDRPFIGSTITEENKSSSIEPYFVRLVVLENKGRLDNGVLNIAFKTLMTVQSKNAFSNSIVYFDTRWDKIVGNKQNPLGYLLTGIVVSTENLYNREELLEEIRARTAIIAEVPIPDVVVGDTTDSPETLPVAPVTIGIPTLGDE